MNCSLAGDYSSIGHAGYMQGLGRVEFVSRIERQKVERTLLGSY